MLSFGVSVYGGGMDLGRPFFVDRRLLTEFSGMVVPLIVINTLVIVYELVLG